ncbi:hypothetical protein C8039_17485 [Halogeometricum sp. wsp3]|nr:hypothetical protein C8039_17485 [Halogeometricum sp. wsp3]
MNSERSRNATNSPVRFLSSTSGTGRSDGPSHFDERWANMLGYTLNELDPTVDTWDKLIHPRTASGPTRH